MKDQHIIGCHSEWNLGSPGGWDYQRITQNIGKALGVIGLIDVLDVLLAMCRCPGIRNIVNIEAERLGQVVMRIIRNTGRIISSILMRNIMPTG